MSIAKFKVATRQSGVTLVELMVSLAVGLIIVGALAFYFAGQKASYSYQEALAGMQDSARTALIYISRDLRLAGYYGCVPQGGQEQIGTADDNIAPAAGAYSQNVLDLTTQQTGVTGVAPTTPLLEGGWELAVLGQNAADQVAWENGITKDADRLVINIAQPFVVPSTGSTLTAAVMPTKTSPIVGNGTVADVAAAFAAKQLQQRDVVAVADCKRAVVFAVSNNPVGGNTLNHRQAINSANTTDFQHIFGSDLAGPAEIFKMQRVRYYLRETRGQYSLHRCQGWRMTGDSSAEYCAGLLPGGRTELVEGVDDLQFQYGVATSCNGNGMANYQYYDALATDPEREPGSANRVAALQRTARAVAVKIEITLQAPGIARDQFTADANGNRDGKYRRKFSTVVELRNGCKV